MRLATKLPFRSLLLSLAAAVVLPSSAHSSLFEVSAQSLAQDPYNLCGRIESRLGGETRIASGGLVSSGVALTAADAVWNAEDGFSTRVIFQRARRGSNIAQTSKGAYIVLLARFTTSTDENTRVATNVAGIIFRGTPANGRHLHLLATKDRLTIDTHNFIVGYTNSVGGGKRMVTYSGLGFRKVGKNLYSPVDQSISELSKGGPVFHFTNPTQPGEPSDIDLVGIVVGRGIIRGFTQREISEILGFGG